MKRPLLTVGAAVLVIAAGATAAWWSQRPQTATLEPATPQPATPTITTAAIDLPESATPPEPTSADFAGSNPKPPSPAASPPVTEKEGPPIDWAALPIDDLRRRANADDVTAMEELARRLVHGEGMAKDQQAGAGWLLRAAQRGSAQAAFNVGVMYERGFVIERDSSKAIEWYRRAIDANLPMAKHNLALLLRDGKGVARDVKEAVELLRSAARQGMAASMFTLGDIYDRGDGGLKDPAIALAWFAITGEFERQTNRSGDSQLGKMASQRAQVLQRILLPGELERAQQFGQAEFKQIVEALQPPKPEEAPAETAAASPPAPSPAAGSESDPAGWPKAVNDQIRVIQQALFDLKLLRDKPDGALGPMTRTAIRSFQRSVAIAETGEPTREVFVALQEAIARGDATKPNAPAGVEPPPASSDPARPAPTPDPAAWPAAAVDQIKAIQGLLRDLNFSREAPDGVLGPATRSAIRDFERSLGLAQTGEPTKAVFDALREMRSLTPKPD